MSFEIQWPLYLGPIHKTIGVHVVILSSRMIVTYTNGQKYRDETNSYAFDLKHVYFPSVVIICSPPILTMVNSILLFI